MTEVQAELGLALESLELLPPEEMVEVRERGTRPMILKDAHHDVPP